MSRRAGPRRGRRAPRSDPAAGDGKDAGRAPGAVGDGGGRRRLSAERTRNAQRWPRKSPAPAPRRESGGRDAHRGREAPTPGPGWTRNLVTAWVDGGQTLAGRGDAMTSASPQPAPKKPVGVVTICLIAFGILCLVSVLVRAARGSLGEPGGRPMKCLITVVLLVLASGCVRQRPGGGFSVPLGAPPEPPPPIAKCRDGTYSASHSQTCSSQGGVAEWLPGASP